MTQEKTEEQTELTWLDEELKSISTPIADFEKLETLKLESGKVVKFTIDFSQPFRKWNDVINGSVKAILPVTHKGVKKNLWVNVKNPLYGQICNMGKLGKKEFQVSTTGSQKDTRYTIVEED